MLPFLLFGIGAYLIGSEVVKKPALKYGHGGKIDPSEKESTILFFKNQTIQSAKRQGAQVNGDIVYLYHGTSPANQKKIIKSNKLKAGTWLAADIETANRFGRMAINSGNPAVSIYGVYAGNVIPSGNYFTTQGDLFLSNGVYVPKKMLKDGGIVLPDIPNTMNFWHGGNLDDYDNIIAQKNGRYEYGAGLYLTTHFGTANKYAKGSRKLYLITVENGNDISKSLLDVKDVNEFVKKYVIGGKKKEISQRLEKYFKDGKIKAFIFNNIMLNEKAIKSTNTKNLRQFLVDNNIDYETVDNAYGWHETMLVLYNMKKIVNVVVVTPADRLIKGIENLLDDAKYEDGGLIAPNGKESNLNEQQYNIVRTPAFKKWFGDWENDPENSSKVVDENGEPLIVWHFSKRLKHDYDRFTVFNTDRQLGSHFGHLNQVKHLSIFEQNLHHDIDLRYEDFRFYQVFLNIRKPIRLKDEGYFEPELLLDTIGDDNFSDSDWKYINNTVSSEHNTITDRVKFIVKKNFGHDGVVYLNRFECGVDKDLINDLWDVSDDVFREQVPESEDSWIAFYPEQIKLADGSNKTFDADDDDIRLAKGGIPDEFWGSVGAGVLPICASTGRILLNYRSDAVMQPNTWNLYGGKLDDDELEDGVNKKVVMNAAKREFNEETGYNGEIELIPSYIFKVPDFTYYNFIGLIDEEFTPEMNWESEGNKWCTLKEFLAIKPKHFGLEKLIKNDLETIKKYSK